MEHKEALVDFLKEQMEPNERRPDDENLLNLHQVHRIRFFYWVVMSLKSKGEKPFAFPKLLSKSLQTTEQDSYPSIALLRLR